jgi:hypothetical protein
VDPKEFDGQREVAQRDAGSRHRSSVCLTGQLIKIGESYVVAFSP